MYHYERTIKFMDFIYEILKVAIGAAVGGLFTLMGAKMQINHDIKKEIYKEKQRLEKERLEEEQKLNELRPRLEIVDCQPIAKYRETKKTDGCVILCPITDYQKNKRLEFYYSSDVLDCKKWVCVEYVLKNTGYTEIDHIYVSTNLQKQTSLFDVLNESYKYGYYNKYLNYDVYIEKTIKMQEMMTLKICYPKNEIVVSNMGTAQLTIWLVDINGNWWSQPLFAPYNLLKNSKRSSLAEYKEDTDVKSAYKCFKNPLLW